METIWKASLGRQFKAAIDMLENALAACPDELWGARILGNRSPRPDLSEFWYVAYYTLFWLDLYLSGSVAGFAPPAPFTLAELDPAGLLPERRYAKEDLLAYLEHNRRKCRGTIETLVDENAQRICSFPWGKVSFAELLLENMRHVQEHAAQLNLFLGQTSGTEARWVAQSDVI